MVNYISQLFAPIFNEIKDASGAINGCLLGTVHNLVRSGHSIRDIQGIDSVNSKMMKCFFNSRLLAQSAAVFILMGTLQVFGICTLLWKEGYTIERTF